MSTPGPLSQNKNITDRKSSSYKDEALRALNMKLANLEIAVDEYEKRKKIIEES